MVMRLHCEETLWNRSEKLWNRSEKVEHLAYKYWCVLKGSGIIKMIRNLTQSWSNYKHCTQKDVYGTTRYIYRVQKDIIMYQIYQLVGGFSAKFV